MTRPPGGVGAARLLAGAGIVPVHADTDLAAVVARVRACFAGGVRAFEFADRVPGAVETFAALRAVVEREMPELALGAGTVTTVEAAEAFVAAGASFLVGPVLAADVLAWSVATGTPYVPGVATPTEAWRAHEAGAEVVKLFPAGALGPDYLRSLLVPLPRLAVMVTGGIEATPAAVTAWFEAGAVAVGLGSDLLPRKPATAARAAEITASCRALMAAAAARRSRP